MSAYTIEHEDGRGYVLVKSGSRSYITTPLAAGMALCGLGSESPSASTDLTWTDLLATNGVAVGIAGPDVLTLVVRPAMSRIVPHVNGSGTPPTPRTVTYPPTLTCMMFTGKRFQRGLFYCLKPTTLPTLTVATLDPVACHFLYGNIYPAGHICWGTVVTAGKIHSLTDLENMFYGSGFNGDLYAPALLPTAASTVPFHTMMQAGGTLPPPRANAYSINMATIVAKLRRG